KPRRLETWTRYITALARISGKSGIILKNGTFEISSSSRGVGARTVPAVSQRALGVCLSRPEPVWFSLDRDHQVRRDVNRPEPAGGCARKAGEQSPNVLRTSAHH